MRMTDASSATQRRLIVNLVEVLIFAAVAEYANRRLTGKLAHLVVEPNDKAVLAVARQLEIVGVRRPMYSPPRRWS